MMRRRHLASLILYVDHTHCEDERLNEYEQLLVDMLKGGGWHNMTKPLTFYSRERLYRQMQDIAEKIGAGRNLHEWSDVDRWWRGEGDGWFSWFMNPAIHSSARELIEVAMADAQINAEARIATLNDRCGCIKGKLLPPLELVRQRDMRVALTDPDKYTALYRAGNVVAAAITWAQNNSTDAVDTNWTPTGTYGGFDKDTVEDWLEETETVLAAAKWFIGSPGWEDYVLRLLR